MELTPLELWLLARTASGYEIPSTLPDGISTDVAALVQAACRLDYRDREFLVRKTAPERVWKQIQAVNTESPQPQPQDIADRPRFQIIAADDLDKLPPLQWLVHQEIVENGVCVLYGESGVGKSFIALDYAMKLAAKGISVIYAPTEGEGGYRKRVNAWKAFHTTPRLPALYFAFGGVMLHDKALMAQVLPQFRQIAPRLIIIDTLAMGMAGLDENNARDVTMFMVTCRQFSYQLNTAILLVHHTSKAGVMERGSTVLRGNADTMIRLSDADDVIMVECSKTKDEEKFPARYVALIKHDDSLVPIPAEQLAFDAATLTTNQRKLLDLLALETNLDGLPIRDAADMTGLSLGSVTRALSNLLKKKMVEKNGSYRITAVGLEAIGRKSDPLDPNADPGKKAAVSPLRSADPHDPPVFQSHESHGYANHVDQVDQVDHPVQQSFASALPPRRKNNQYQQGS